MRLNRSSAFLLLLAVAVCVMSGCGSEEPGPALQPVTGTVYLNDNPLPNADVTFLPLGETPGIGGQSRTNEEGKFEVNYGRGGEGLPEGQYKVAVSVRVMPDGSPAPPEAEVDPIESQGQETLPPKYSNIEKSELQVTVEQGKPLEIKLTK